MNSVKQNVQKYADFYEFIWLAVFDDFRLWPRLTAFQVVLSCVHSTLHIAVNLHVDEINRSQRSQ